MSISVRNLTKFYGHARGVEGLNLEVNAGEVFGFIGPNGAGKSTTIRMLMQLIYPTSGEMTILGERVVGDMPSLRRRIGYLPAEVNYYRDMTGRQLLGFAGRAFGVDADRARRAVDSMSDLLELSLDKSVKSYSLGNRKKLAIVQALLHDPELIVLDEPTSGLDPLMQSRFFDLLRERNERGATVFLSTHILTEVEKFCERVGIVKEGRLIQVSPVSDISGRSVKLVQVRFERDGDLREALGLREIDPDVAYTDGLHTFHCRAHIHEVLHRISEHPMLDISVRQPTLEELFMHYYGEEAK